MLETLSAPLPSSPRRENDAEDHCDQPISSNDATKLMSAT
jgi:hypothetical protein